MQFDEVEALVSSLTLNNIARIGYWTWVLTDINFLDYTLFISSDIFTVEYESPKHYVDIIDWVTTTVAIILFFSKMKKVALFP